SFASGIGPLTILRRDDQPMPQSNLRPLTFGEVLDGAFSLYRRYFSIFFMTALLPYIPLVALWMLLALLVPATPEGLGALALLQTLTSPYTLIASVLIWAAITLQGAEAYAGGLPQKALPAYPAALGRLHTI